MAFPSVLRASPSPQAARPDPRGRPVGSDCAPGRLGLPVLSEISCGRHAVAYTPAGTQVFYRSCLHLGWQPSPAMGWVGSCITNFGASSAVHLRYGLPARGSPSRRPLRRRLRRLRYLHRRFEGYRLERRALPGGYRNPLKTSSFSRRTHRSVWLACRRIGRQLGWEVCN